MPLPEGYLPREGDILILHAVVETNTRPDSDTAYVKVNGRYGAMNVDLDKIVGVFARHFDEGDIVRSIGDMTGQNGTVIAMYEGMVWIKDGHGQMQTVAANELELAPALDQDFVQRAPEEPTDAFRSVAAVPLGGAHIPEPFCEPAPPHPSLMPKAAPIADDDMPF